MGCGKECLEEGGCGYRCLQVIRWLPVVFVTAILGWAWYAYVIQLCFNTVSNDFQRAFYLIFFHTFLFLFIWSYLATVFAKLRRPPAAFFLPPDVLTEISEVRDDDRLIAAVLHRYASREKLPIRMRSYEGAGQYLRYCAKCRCLKPDRSHHCSMCGQCILKFDHHCPWVNTCVSFHNYKYFILFLGYGVALCLFGCLSDLPYFVLFWKNDMHERSDVIIGKFHMLFLFFVSGMFSLSLGGLFFYHLYLTAQNRTTIEAFRPPMMSNGEDKHAFNMGIRANFRQVFGTRPLLWFLPVYSSEGDGFAMDCSTCQTVPVDESPPDFASPFGGRDETDRTDARHDIGDASSDGHICGANGMPIRPTSYRVLLSDVEDEEQQSAQFGTPPLSQHTTSTTASPPLSSGNKDNGQQSRNGRTYYSHGAATA